MNPVLRKKMFVLVKTVVCFLLTLLVLWGVTLKIDTTNIGLMFMAMMVWGASSMMFFKEDGSLTPARWGLITASSLAMAVAVAGKIAEPIVFPWINIVGVQGLLAIAVGAFLALHEVNEIG